MRREVTDAVKILKAAHDILVNSDEIPSEEMRTGCLILVRAIGHIAYPDRDIHPTSRHGTKGNPVIR